MASNHEQKSMQIQRKEHDQDADAKRVVVTSSRGRTVSYEDTGFVSGDSPATLDINTDLNRNGKDGYLINDGDGNIKVEISDDGTNYGGQHTLQDGDVLTLENSVINKIRITHVTDTAYRVLVL